MSSTIIKAGQTPRISRSMCTLDLRDITERAEAVLAAARVRAEEIIFDARTRAQTERQGVLAAAQREGRAKGFEEGRAAAWEAALTEAREKFQQDGAALLSALKEMTQGLNRRYESLYAAARRDVVVLAIAIASRICDRFSEMDDVAHEAAEKACGAALEMLGSASEATLRTHPDDSKAIAALADRWSNEIKGLRHVRLAEDASIARGGGIVENADSRIDATINSRVERIAGELVADWRRRMRELSIES